MTPIYFLSLLALVYGNLIIDIDVTSDQPSIDIRNFISTEVISDVERATFEIEDAELKKAVANYTNDGTVPDFVYVKKTGEENDLYAKYKDFDEIKRTVKPIYVDAKITKVECMNNTNKMRINTDWKINGNLTIADKITHIVYYNNSKLTIESAWGENVFKPIPKPKHGDNVQACTMSVKIEYEATIAGDVAVDYTKKRSSKYGDHHFYAYNVFNVQEAAGLRRSVVSYETITVTYPKMLEIPVSNTTSGTKAN